MYVIRKNGATSNILRTTLRSSVNGQGLTGLAYDTSGLIISTVCDNEAAATTYTAAGSTIETIATLGTFATPTDTKCRFKEVDSTNHPGLYEIQLANARFAVSSAKLLRVTISGAANLLQKDIAVQLNTVDLDISGGKVPATVAAGDGVDAAIAISSAHYQKIAKEAHNVAGVVYHVKYNAGETMGNDALSWGTADLTAGAGVKTDIEAATTGDLALVGAGTYAIGNNRVLIPTGVRVKGAGIDQTIFTNTQTDTLPCWVPASRVELSDLTIDTSATAGAGAFGVGSTDAAAANVVLRRVKLLADADALVVTNASATTIEAFDCIISGEYDSIACFSGNHVLHFHECTINTRGPTSSGVFFPSRGVAANQGTVWLWNSNVNCQDGNAAGGTIGLYASGTGNIIQIGGSIRTFNSGGTDLAIQNEGTGKIVLVGVDYDRTKTSNTGGGSIIDIPIHAADQDGVDIADAVDLSTLASDLNNLRDMSKNAITAGTVNDLAATSLSFVTNLTEATNDHYKNRIIEFTSGALLGQGREITDYDGGTKTITVNEAFTEAPANGVTFKILGYIVP